MKQLVHCQICNQLTDNQESQICENCLKLRKQGLLIYKNKTWQIDLHKGIDKLCKNNFYNPEKQYMLKQTLFGEYEKIVFEIISDKLDKKYVVFPQINLQAIIETDSKQRNDELYRNIDFVIFEKSTYKPVLAIELNDKSHQVPYKIKRDESVKKICEKAHLKLIFLQNKDLYTRNTVEIFNQIKKYL